MSKRNPVEDITSKNGTDSGKPKANKDFQEDEIIAWIEISDGNCLKQTVEYFRNTTTMVPLVFYKDRMEIVRGNHEATLVNKAVLDNINFIIKYQVNVELFNEPLNVKIVRKPTGVIDANGIPEIIEEKVPEPRHIFIPVTDTFHKQCKTIARRDGFRIIIYKSSEGKESKNYNKKINGLYHDCYMKASKISANSAPDGEIGIFPENTDDFKDYGFSFPQPCEGKINQKIKLIELCSICSNFVRHNCEIIDLMCYIDGFRMKGGESQSVQEFGWGKYSDTKYLGKKGKIVIGGPSTKHNNFGVPLDFIKALSKLQTIAGNGGIAAIFSHSSALQIVIPISVIGRLIITIIPPDDDEEEDTSTK
jgi:hypothetical protein